MSAYKNVTKKYFSLGIELGRSGLELRVGPCTPRMYITENTLFLADHKAYKRKHVPNFHHSNDEKMLAL